MRFVIISVLPDPLKSRVREISEYFNSLIGAKEALRYPPHITLRTGIICPDDQADEVGKKFLNHASKFSRIQVKSSGLFFRIYEDQNGTKRGMAAWKIDLDPGLLNLHQGLLKFKDFIKAPQGEYTPHVSIAYHDVSEERLKILEKRSGDIQIPELSWILDHAALFHESAGTWIEFAKTKLVPQNQ